MVLDRYLYEHGTHREPLVHIVKLMVDEVVDEIVREEMGEYIRSTLQSYFIESQAILLIDTLIGDIVGEDYLSELVIYYYY